MEVQAVTAIVPVRLRLSRAKGFNLQAYSMAINGLPAVNCARPGTWGNPFHGKALASLAAVTCFGGRGDDERALNHALVGLYANWLCDWPRGCPVIVRAMLPPDLGTPPSRPEIESELRGHNLACWCRLDEPCHADVLLEMARETGA